MSRSVMSQLDRLGNIPNLPLLTAEQECELGRRIRSGDRNSADVRAAIDTLVRHNLRLAAHIASAYYRRRRGDFDVLWSGAQFGLLRAAELFDPGFDRRFSTYASLWIKQGIARDSYKIDAPVSIPYYLRRMLSRIDRGLPPSPHGGTTTARVGAIHAARVAQKSPLRDDGLRTGPYQACLSFEPDHLADLIRSEHLASLRGVFKRLSPREWDVIRSRYFGEIPESFQSIGLRYGITKSRVQQIEQEVLAKLRGALKLESNERAG